MPRPLVGLEESDLIEIVTARGEAPYRGRQLYEGIYRSRAGTLAEVRGLPAGLRRSLADEFKVGLPAIERRFESADGTIRYLLRLDDEQKIETVWMPEAGRDTICISTQAGCPVDCKFCFTALLGLARNLTAGEIVGQVLLAAQENRVLGGGPAQRGLVGHDVRSDALGERGGEGSRGERGENRARGGRDGAPGGRSGDDARGERGGDEVAGARRLNVVMMGMGEPLLNLPNVIQATRLLTDPNGLGLSPRRVTLSTAGITPKIAELGRELVRPKLAVSLNASTEEMRERLMPITKKYKLAGLLEACRAYPLRPWEKLSFEYVLLSGVNDSEADARRVVRLLANLKCMVNLIAFNPGPGIDFQTPEPERVRAFQEIVKRSFPCFIRKPRGRDIYAACGQLKAVDSLRGAEAR